MPKHHWTIVSKSSIVDKNSNNISIINVIEQLKFLVDPSKNKNEQLVPVDFTIVSLWSRSDFKTPEKFISRINFKSPENKIIAGPEIEIDLTEFKRFRSLFNVNSIPIDVSGIYEFITEYKLIDGTDWIKSSSTEIEIEIEIENKN